MVLTGTYDVSAAVDAMRLGAVGFVRKGETDLVTQLDEALRQAQLAAGTRRHAESIERQVRDSVRYLVDHASQPMVIHRHGVILHVNQALLQTFGVESRDEVTGGSIYALMAPEDRARFEEQTLRAEAGVSTPVIYQARKTDGSPVELEVLVVKVVFQGEPATLGIVQDLTERRREQAARLASERLTSIGSVAAGAAHEINNPLSYLFGALDTLQVELTEPNEDVAEALAALSEGLQRIRSISADLEGHVARDAQRRAGECAAGDRAGGAHGGSDGANAGDVEARDE